MHQKIASLTSFKGLLGCEEMHICVPHLLVPRPASKAPNCNAAGSQKQQQRTGFGKGKWRVCFKNTGGYMSYSTNCGCLGSSLLRNRSSVGTRNFGVPVNLAQRGAGLPISAVPPAVPSGSVSGSVSGLYRGLYQGLYRSPIGAVSQSHRERGNRNAQVQASAYCA